MPSLNSYIVGVLMLIAYITTLLFTPEADKYLENTVDLEAIIPQEFGQWKVDEISTLQSVQGINAGQSDILYSQILSRVYMNDSGQRIMFLIAYGSNQSDSLSVHKPEVCYPAQGFKVIKKEKTNIAFSEYEMPIIKLVAERQDRIEPIIYWIKIGNKVVSGNLDSKIVKLKYALTGLIPDGYLVRVSMLEYDIKKAYLIESNFIRSLKKSMGFLEKIIFNSNKAE